MSTKTGHIYITRDSRILSGEPIVKGTRTPVRAIAEWGKFAASPARGRGGFETRPYRRQSSRLTFMAEEMMQQLRYI